MNKKLVLILVVVLAVVFGYWLLNKSGKLPSLQTFYSPVPGGTPTPTPKLVSRPTPAIQPSGGSLKPYSDLVNEYQGKRIQFDERCQVVPNSATYKNGTSVMLDNRSANAVTIKVGDASYSLSSYGYRIVNLSSSYLPKELPISCGKAGNVGKILLQAIISQ